MINYQAVARQNGKVVSSNLLPEVSFFIHKTSCTGTIVYDEKHGNVPTNPYGLFTVRIGDGSTKNGVFPTPGSWASGTYFLEVEIKFPDGAIVKMPCDNLHDQFVSVPYALASGSGPAGPTGATGSNGASGATGATGPQGNANINGTNKYLLKFNSPITAGNSMVFQDSISPTDQRIGIGNNNPSGILHVGSSNNTKDVLFHGGWGGLSAVNTNSYSSFGFVSQMIFNPKVGAFRVGIELGNEWDASKLGNTSLAMGASVEASGTGSMAMGAYSKAGGNGSLTLGSSLQADSINCIAIGYGYGTSNINDYMNNRRSRSVALGAGSKNPSIFIGSNPTTNKLKPGKVCIGGYSAMGNNYPNFPQSSFEVNGSMGLSFIKVFGGNINLTDTNSVVFTNSVSTVNLPQAASAPGRIYYIKKATQTSAAITIKPFTGEKLEGVTGTLVFGTNSYPECVTIMSDGTEWWILSRQ